MKISRIALASLVSFGVLGGASLNASANHTHYQRILWNKTMAHQKVALKNGKGIIWNKPYRTAKNSKITYRLSHKKGLVMTTLRHMKVKNGSIYYFVKAGKISGWINKSSLKLVKNSSPKAENQPSGTSTVTPAQPTGSVPNSVHYGDTTNNQNPAKNGQSTSASVNNYPSASSVNHYPTDSSSQSTVTPATDLFGSYTTGHIVALPVKSDKKTSKLSKLPQGAVVYEKVWQDGKLAESNVSSTIAVGAPVKIALGDENPTSQLLVRTLDGKVSGYVDRNQVSIGDLTQAELNPTTPKTPAKTVTQTPAASSSAK